MTFNPNDPGAFDGQDGVVYTPGATPDDPGIVGLEDLGVAGTYVVVTADDTGRVTSGTAATVGTTKFVREDGTLQVPPSSGAPTTAEYLVGASDAGLSAERVVTNTASIAWDLTVAGQAKANAQFGSSAGTVTQGNDSRLSDTRTCTGTLTLGTGLTGTSFNGSGNVTATVSYGTSSSTACVGNDSRLSDSRTPTSHAASHASGGGDAVTLAQSQITNLSTDLGLKAPLASPTFTGTVTVPTPANATDAATKGYADSIGAAGAAVLRTPTSDVALGANYSLIVAGRFAIASDRAVSIAANAVLRVA